MAWTTAQERRFSPFRLHTSQRAARMVEVARLRSERTGSGVDPPRRGGPLAHGSSSTPVKPRCFVSMQRSYKKKSRGSLSHEFSAPWIFSLGLSCVSRSKACGLRLASHRGFERDKQGMPNTRDEDGDPAVSTAHCKAWGPLGQFRPQGRILLLGNRPPR
jgi:hypothetical protein